MAKTSVSDELKKYGYVFSGKKTAIELAFVFGLVIFLGVVFSLDIFYEVVLGIICLLFLPLFLKNYAKSKYVQQRFSDLNIYIEQFLYSFEKSGKILDTLRDVLEIFDEGMMKKKISMAINHIENSYDSNAEADALGIIEREYEYEGLKLIHDFALSVEREGGEYRNSAHILLEDRRMWMERNVEHLNEKRQGRVKVLLSIIMTLLICLLIYVLGRNMDVDITKQSWVQFGTTLVLVLDLFIYYLTDRKFSEDYLTQKKKNDYALRLQKKWADYGKKKVGLRKVKYQMDKKVIVREIEKEFPRWILNLSLLLQNDNVQVSIGKSYESAPEIMKMDLKKLIDELKLNPTGIKPYISFMKEYEIPDIESAMKVLYSLSENGNGSVENELGEIVKRNRDMIDRSTKLKNEDDMSGMVVLFLAPQITAGFKMLVDMMVMFTMYFADFGKMLR